MVQKLKHKRLAKVLGTKLVDRKVSYRLPVKRGELPGEHSPNRA